MFASYKISLRTFGPNSLCMGFRQSQCGDTKLNFGTFKNPKLRYQLFPLVPSPVSKMPRLIRVKGAGYSISKVENCSKSKSETTFTLKKTALIHESVSKIFF